MYMCLYKRVCVYTSIHNHAGSEFDKHLLAYSVQEVYYS